VIELRPLELGEIIDRSATFWRSHWRRLYGLFFGFSLAEYVLLKGAQLVQARFAPLSRGGMVSIEAAKENTLEWGRQQVIGGVSLGAAFLIIIIITLLETSAATRYTMPTLLGEKAGPFDGVAYALKRTGRTFAVFGLALAWSLGFLLLLMLPTAALAVGVAAVNAEALKIVLLVLALIAAGLGGVVWLLWCFLKFAPLAQVLAMEELGPIATFRRTNALTSGRVGPGFLGLVKVRLTILVTIIALLLFMISMVSSAPQLILQAVYGNIFDPLHATPDAVPQSLLVPAELVNIAVQSIFAPLYVAFQTVFYIDMRTRREGLDLELKLQRAA
jgi:hypothetical protein